MITTSCRHWLSIGDQRHTFHMPIGECSITLQDERILLRLPVDGEAVICRGCPNWGQLCEQFLEVRPTYPDIKGSRVKLSWLKKHFNNVKEHAHSQLQLEHFTRAYILHLFGGWLFSDHSGIYASLRYLPLLEDFQRCGGIVGDLLC